MFCNRCRPPVGDVELKTVLRPDLESDSRISQNLGFRVKSDQSCDDPDLRREDRTSGGKIGNYDVMT